MGKGAKKIIYKNPEAFSIIPFICGSCEKGELIWNSRDGAVPMMIACYRPGCNGQMSMGLIMPEAMLQVPLFRPIQGMRVVRDVNEEDVKEYVEKMWEDPKFQKKYENKLAALRDCGKMMLEEPPGQPIVEKFE